MGGQPKDRRGRFSADVLAKYPHMAPEDIRVWEKFLVSDQNTLERVDYDVRAGMSLPVPSGTSPEMSRMWVENSKKRIDAVGYRPGERWVIEVKPRLNTSGLGQLLSYTSLYVQEFPSSDLVLMVFLCEQSDADLLPVYLRFGVRVIVV